MALPEFIHNQIKGGCVQAMYWDLSLTNKFQRKSCIFIPTLFLYANVI